MDENRKTEPESAASSPPRRPVTESGRRETVSSEFRSRDTEQERLRRRERAAELRSLNRVRARKR